MLYEVITRDVTTEVGITHGGREEEASFSDLDNDGFLDLFIMSEDGDLLYRNADQGKFENVTSKANIGSKSGGDKILFFFSSPPITRSRA